MSDVEKQNQDSGALSSNDPALLARALITEKLLRWKSALEASHESAPGSSAAVWVEGYIYGLQQALDYLPNATPLPKEKGQQ